MINNICESKKQEASSKQLNVFSIRNGKPAVGNVLRESHVLFPTVLTRTVLDTFLEDPEIVSLPVIDEYSQKPVGLINRYHFMSLMARPYYKEIYLNRQCLEFVSKEPLIVEVSTPLHEVSTLLASAGGKVINEGFIITSGGRHIGMGYSQDVLRVMAEIHRVQAHALARQHHDLEVLVAERTAELEKSRANAERLSRVKSEFLANMSHELRTPMNGIIGMTAMALKLATDAIQHEQLEKVKHASEHLLDILNDILDFSKIEAERMILEQRCFKCGEILDNIHSLLTPKVTEKGLELRFEDMAAVADMPVKGDSMRLQQVLLNLASNAVKFTESGTITLRVSIDEETATEVMLHFEVLDTGIGIAAECQKRLFAAFEQADNSMSRKYGGTGLGLAICKRLVEMMGGYIGVDSKVGHGSRFWFTARFSKVDQKIEEVKDQKPLKKACEQLRARYTGTHVLLVEDEPLNQELVTFLLKEVGFRVDLAMDGEEALEKAKQTQYAMILMDMQMPKLNGIEATRAIQMLPGWQHAPILAMTANAYAEDRQACLNAGMNDHIAKPMRPEKLYEKLLMWLEFAKRQTDTDAQPYFE